MRSIVVYYDSDVPAPCPSRPRSHLAPFGRELSPGRQGEAAGGPASRPSRSSRPPSGRLGTSAAVRSSFSPLGVGRSGLHAPGLEWGSSPRRTSLVRSTGVVLPPRRQASEARSRPAVVGTSLSSAGQSADSSWQRACLGFLAGGLLRLQCARPPLVSAREALASRQGQLRSTAPVVPDVGRPAAGEGAPRKRD